MLRSLVGCRTTARCLVTALAFFVACLPLASQAQTALGELTFLKPQSQALPLNPESFAKGKTGAPALAANLGSHGYLTGVGGVAFAGTAVGADGLRAVDLRYVAGAQDGRRLFVTVEKRDVRRDFPATIYDWQLLPIARFANTDQAACFTLFGQLANQQEQEQRRARGEHILGYHAALKDTLLGWRLLQADILIIRPDAAFDLPTENGRYLLGAGEQRWLVAGQRPDIAANQANYLKFREFMRGQPRKFSSFVVCDHGQEVRLSLDAEAKTVSLTGFPHWYCWRRKIEGDAAFQNLQAQANAQANKSLQTEMQNDRQVLDPADFNRKWTQEIYSRKCSEIFDQIMSANLVQPLPELSRNISANVRELNGVNPIVYNSLVTTMRYAALFRHVRRENPDAYAKFVESLSAVRLVPSVKTPSIMVDPKGPTQIIVRPQ